MGPFSCPMQVLEGWHYKVIGRITRAVYKCLNCETDVVVAIKRITIFDDESGHGVPSSLMREVCLLKELHHANIVQLLDVLNEGTDVLLVFEYVDLNLSKFMKSLDFPRNLLLRKNLLHQILSALSYCHSNKILHRDLKPANILVDPTTSIVRLADFGLAREFVVPVSSYTNEVVTLWYRAPELLFGSTKYSTAVDVWSVSCVFGQMIIGEPLFTGLHTIEMLKMIFSLLGTPTEETWPGVNSVCDFLHSFNPQEPKDLALKFPGLEPPGVDLLSLLRTHVLSTVSPFHFLHCRIDRMMCSVSQGKREFIIRLARDKNVCWVLETLSDTISFKLSDCLLISSLIRISAEDALEHAYFHGL